MAGISDIIKQAQSRKPVNVDLVAAYLGVDIHYAFLENDIAGELESLGDGKYKININATDPTTRRRFTIAHELGHLIFHRSLINNGLDDNRAYRSTNSGRYHNTNIGPKQETEANKFAASLLMPESLLDRDRISPNEIGEQARELGVSKHALSIRLGVPYNG
jgi:Zn-dependent peptidase ImmA (M78 family)